MLSSRRTTPWMALMNHKGAATQKMKMTVCTMINLRLRKIWSSLKDKWSKSKSSSNRKKKKSSCYSKRSPLGVLDCWKLRSGGKGSSVHVNRRTSASLWQQVRWVSVVDLTRAGVQKAALATVAKTRLAQPSKTTMWIIWSQILAHLSQEVLIPASKHLQKERAKKLFTPWKRHQKWHKASNSRRTLVGKCLSINSSRFHYRLRSSSFSLTTFRLPVHQNRVAVILQSTKTTISIWSSTDASMRHPLVASRNHLTRSMISDRHIFLMMMTSATDSFSSPKSKAFRSWNQRKLIAISSSYNNAAIVISLFRSIICRNFSRKMGTVAAVASHHSATKVCSCSV